MFLSSTVIPQLSMRHAVTCQSTGVALVGQLDLGSVPALHIPPGYLSINVFLFSEPAYNK